MPTTPTEINTLLDLCAHPQTEEIPIVELLIKTLGANRTLPNSTEPILAVIIRNFTNCSVNDSALLPIYIEIFLRHNFDMQCYGAVCLRALIDSILDEHLLSAAHLLLEPQFNISFRDYQTIIDTLNFKIAYYDFQSKNHYLANLYFAYQKMLLNRFSVSNIHYANIASYTCAYEQKINNIMFNPAESPRKHIYLFLTNGILIIQNHPNLYLCSAIEITPLTQSTFSLSSIDELSSIKHQTIHSISFSAQHFHPIITLNLDSDYLQITHNPQNSALEISLKPCILF